jgi:hypothetical protein
VANKKSILIHENSEGLLKVEVFVISDWDGFEKLIKFMKTYYNVEVSKKIDGPDARRWILRRNSESMELHHDDLYGNTLIACDLESNDLVKSIGLDLTERFG